VGFPASRCVAGLGGEGQAEPVPLTHPLLAGCTLFRPAVDPKCQGSKSNVAMDAWLPRASSQYPVLSPPPCPTMWNKEEEEHLCCLPYGCGFKQQHPFGWG